MTLLRLVPMPVVCWLVYAGQLWPALFLGILIGSTDFVDGYLARRHGPTVLGSLMDPIADKVFIAFAYVPLADLGILPAWPVALLFVRELVVTALRSSYEQRNLEMRTSYLAKAKTWAQMQGIGIMLLFVLLGDQRPVLLALVLVLIAAPLAAGLAFWAVKRRFWRGAWVMSAVSVSLLFLYAWLDTQTAVHVLLYGVVAITWLSGLDYLAVGLRELRGRGDVCAGDATRLAGAVALPTLLFAVLVTTPVSPWPLLALLALELAVGGLDNLLSHHRRAATTLAWTLRLLGITAGLGMALFLAWIGSGAYASWTSFAALGASALGVAREFWRGSDIYLDHNARNRSRRRTLRQPDAETA